MANNNKFRIPLEDVESEHCALIVDNGLAKLNGVESHRVELNNKEAVIETQNRETVSEAVKTIQDLGYGVPTVKISFPVLQMTCASCAVSVESMLKSQAVVVNASVNYANAEVSVEFIPSLIQVESLRKVVQSIGYNLLLDESTSGDGTIEHIQKENFKTLRKKTYWALILSIPAVIIGMFFMNMPFANQIMWVLSTPVLFWLGKDFYINDWKQAKHRSANMDTLVALSTKVAYIFSVFNTLFSEFWHERGLHAHVYFEAASVMSNDCRCSNGIEQCKCSKQ